MKKYHSKVSLYNTPLRILALLILQCFLFGLTAWAGPVCLLRHNGANLAIVRAAEGANAAGEEADTAIGIEEAVDYIMRFMEGRLNAGESFVAITYFWQGKYEERTHYHYDAKSFTDIRRDKIRETILERTKETAAFNPKDKSKVYLTTDGLFAIDVCFTPEKGEKAKELLQVVREEYSAIYTAETGNSYPLTEGAYISPEHIAQAIRFNLIERSDHCPFIRLNGARHFISADLLHLIEDAFKAGRIACVVVNDDNSLDIIAYFAYSFVPPDLIESVVRMYQRIYGTEYSSQYEQQRTARAKAITSELPLGEISKQGTGTVASLAHIGGTVPREQIFATLLDDDVERVMPGTYTDPAQIADIIKKNVAGFREVDHVVRENGTQYGITQGMFDTLVRRYFSQGRLAVLTINHDWSVDSIIPSALRLPVVDVADAMYADDAPKMLVQSFVEQAAGEITTAARVNVMALPTVVSP